LQRLNRWLPSRSAGAAVENTSFQPYFLSTMIDVTITNFDEEVIAASMTTPVLVDFWAPWCGPCKSLGPILEKVELEYAGRFKLAKVDSDQEQQISAAFGIRSIPTCMLVMNGQPVDGFTGALPEGKVKEFLDKHLPPAEEVPEEEPVAEPDAATDPEGALEKLQHAVATDPANDNARFDYVKLLLQLGRSDDAKVAFAPVIAQTTVVRRFDSLKRWMDAIDFVATDGDSALAGSQFDAKIAANKRDFDARFGKARGLMAEQRWTDALDELLEILMRDKAWSDDLARKTYIAVLDIMEAPKPKVADGQIPPEDAEVARYRRRLSSVILS
jgi:putative thioredoxin